MNKTLIVYDDKCLFCISTKKRIEKLDRKRKLQWIGIPQFNYEKHELKKEDIEKEIHVLQDDKVYKGYYAFKQIAKQIPLLYISYILMVIPGIDFIGNKMYRIAAKHRHRLHRTKKN